MSKRKAFSMVDKNWWMKEYENSGFSTRPKFLEHVERQKRLKVGDWHKKVRNRDIPSKSTMNNWYRNEMKRKIEKNKHNKKKKTRQPVYEALEKLLVQYIQNAATKLSEYGLGLSWSVIDSRARLIAAHLLETGVMSEEEGAAFKCSRGWLSALKKRNNLKCMKLVGEGNTLSEEVLNEKITEFRLKLKQVMDDNDVSPSCVFNADQTGLYFKRFPSTTICEEVKRREMKGTKSMKDKDRITAMVCTSSLGVKVPLAYVGKSNNPRCFSGKVRPSHYTYNKKAWFNMGVTKWWFESVFIPFFSEHFESEGVDTHGVVILDGCSAHNGIQEWLVEKGYSHIHVNTHRASDKSVRQ